MMEAGPLSPGGSDYGSVGLGEDPTVMDCGDASPLAVSLVEEEVCGGEEEQRWRGKVRRASAALLSMTLFVGMVQSIRGRGGLIARTFAESDALMSGRGAIGEHKAAGVAEKDPGPAPATGREDPKMPNIAFVYIDDQGYNDMGPDSTDLSWTTPTIDNLADHGIRMANYYGAHLCTPSRASLLTGLYPIHTGMQHSMITGNAPWGLPLSFELLPQVIKKAGNYITHHVGKWHLGHYAEAHTSLERGFDTFYGFYTGFESYFSHAAEVTVCGTEYDCFYDFRNDAKPVWAVGNYSMGLYEDYVSDLVTHHDPEGAPFFLYYAVQAVHAPVQAPESVVQEYKEQLSAIPNTQRREFAALTITLDQAVASLVHGLQVSENWDNTVMVLASDNGANPNVMGAGSNWPLRGMKGYFFEGAIKVHGIICSPMLPISVRGRKYQGLFHVTDWMPTLVGGLLGRSDALPEHSDGWDHWSALMETTDAASAAAAPREEMLINIDYLDGYEQGALRVGDMKVLTNVQYQPRWPVPHDDGIAVGGASDWEWAEGPYRNFLFNLTADPYEETNLVDTMPELFATLRRRVDQYKKDMRKTAYCAAANDDAADAVMFETQFVGPWLSAGDFKCPHPSWAIDADDADDATGTLDDAFAVPTTTDDPVNSGGDIITTTDDPTGGDSGGDVIGTNDDILTDPTDSTLEPASSDGSDSDPSGSDTPDSVEPPSSLGSGSDSGSSSPAYVEDMSWVKDYCLYGLLPPTRCADYIYAPFFAP